MSDVIIGTGEDGQDLQLDDFRSKFLLAVRDRQEAVWAVLSHGRVVVVTGAHPFDGERVVTGCTVYVPTTYQQWWEKNEAQCLKTLPRAASSAWGVDYDWATHSLEVDWILETPEDLKHFLAQQTGRPMPRRYNTTAVQLQERDGVAWLTPPEIKLYDALKETGWLFVPQPPFLGGQDLDKRPDFLIYWRHKAAWAVIVEIDSDRYHPPSQQEPDRAKERMFESRGFSFLTFSAKRVLNEPMGVIQEIAQFCTQKFGQ